MAHQLERLNSRRVWLFAGAVAVAIGIAVVASDSGDRGTERSRSAEPSPAVTLPGIIGELGSEVVTLRTETSKTYATDTPGRFKIQMFTAPIHYRAADGSWANIDTSLDSLLDGRIGTEAAAWPSSFATLGDSSSLASIAVAPGLSASFGLDGSLPVPAVRTGSSVRYAQIRPGVSLEITARNRGIKDLLTLDSRDAPRQFDFPLALHGLNAAIDAATGAVIYTDVSGVERARSLRGYMYDSAVDDRSGQPALSGAVTYALVPGSDGSTTLRVALDNEWLDDPARQYPVLVDPQFGPQTTTDDTFVQNTFPSNGYNTDPKLHVGTFNGGTDKVRSFMMFDPTTLNGKIINSATLQLHNIWSYSCQPRSVTISRITENWSGPSTDWDGPNYSDYVASGSFAHGRSGCNPTGAFVTFDVLTAVQSWANNTWPAFGLALTTNETDSYSWKKFTSADGTAGYRPNIVAIYTDPGTNHNPFGSLDIVSGQQGRVRVAGWAADQEAMTNPISYHVYIDGNLAGGWVANGYRPDVGAAHPGYGNYHGFDRLITASTGTHTVCVYAINVPTGPNPQLGCGSATVTAPTTPTKPLNVTAAADTDGTIAISWLPPASDGGADIDTYYIYPFDPATHTWVSAKGYQTACGTCTNATFTGLDYGANYYFKAKAHNSVGNGFLSDPSNTVTVSTIPSAPQNPAATENGTTATITWTPPATNNGATIDEYTIWNYVYNSQTGNWDYGSSIPACGTCTSATWPGLSPTGQYYFRLNAHNANGYSPAVQTNNIPTAPAAPGQPLATAAYAGAVVSWPAPAYDGGRNITQYDLYATDTDNNNAVTHTGCGGACVAAREYTYTNLVPGHHYYFRVTATNSIGTSGYSPQSTDIQSTPTQTLAPTNVTATRGDKQATVNWTAPVLSVSGFTTYTVRTYRDSDNFLLKTTQAGTATTNCGATPAPCLVVTGLINGTTVYFRVTSTNAVVTSVESAPSNAVTPAGRPFPPESPTATAGDKSVSVTFTAPSARPDGTPGDNGDTIGGYTLIVRKVSDDTEAGRTPGGGSPLELENLTNGTEYYATVHATNTIGDSDTARTANFTPAGPPSAPTNVTATQSNGLISVNWTRPSNQGSEITKYTITATPTEAGDPLTGESDGAVLGAVPIPDLTIGTTYTFTVIATNAKGDSASSAPSNEIKQAGPPDAPHDVFAVETPPSATISWTQPAHHDSPITGYRVTAYSSSTGQSRSEEINNPSATEHTMTGLAEGPYIFSLVARSALGDSVPSSTGGNAVRPKYVALGDSFSSGEGAPPFFKTGNNCNRSDRSYAYEFVATHPYFDITFPACSGARISHVLEEEQHTNDTVNGQISLVPADANLVTLTIGGNDVDFGGKIRHCIKTIDCHLGFAGMEDDIRALRPRLAQVYTAIHNRAEGAAIFVFTYPKFLSSEVPRCGGIFGLGGDEIDWIRDMTVVMNATIRDAASGVPNVSVIDVENDWAGPPHHEVCGEDPWHNGIRAPWNNILSSFHPNEAGYAHEAQKLAAAAGLLRPTVTAVNPADGVDARTPCRTNVTISGTNFGPNPIVRFGGTPADNVARTSATQLAALAPPGNLGTVNVVVQQNHGLYSGTSAPHSGATFTYTADTTKPTTTAALMPAANQAGWSRANTTVLLSATDPACDDDVASITYSASGATSLPPATVSGRDAELNVAVEGETLVSFAAVDTIGNQEPTRQVVVRLDKTAPTSISVTPDRQPDHDGWYNHGFVATWAGTDALSGIDSCTSRSYTGPDTASGSMSGSCTDRAGNNSSPVTLSFKYDATAPANVQGQARPPDHNGWYNHPLTVTFTGTDATSGIESCTSASYSGPDATGITIDGTCTDRAGNTTNATFGPFSYDATDPTTSIDGEAVQTFVAGTPVTGAAADNLSGIDATTVTFAGTIGQGTVTRAATCVSGCGTVNSRWRVETAGLVGPYTVTAASTDRAGNQGPSSAAITAVIL